MVKNELQYFYYSSSDVFVTVTQSPIVFLLMSLEYTYHDCHLLQ